MNNSTQTSPASDKLSVQSIKAHEHLKNAYVRDTAQNYKRNTEGRFIVTLPKKEEILRNVSKSKDIALSRFHILERKLNRDAKLKKGYTNFIHEYLNLRYMKKLPLNTSLMKDTSLHYYLPHHCVLKDTNTTTRLRVVFDASSQTTSGISLNDALMVGPVLQQ
ncbi:uncharacterized protein LOC114930748 [Nylanderia fulva]|uniref:uncharacterized protein LOC114930748 n=1 Tax=Nylanderia fulva TaxID=613905 RepID=UPI0010FB0944|nr:uncharacterized protein LOC114930748 [Nylanderia fulva]